MEVENRENKTSSIIKKLERYLSLNRHSTSQAKTTKILSKSRSWHSIISKESKSDKKVNERTPNGCLCVYVGVEKQRFVIKIEFANHPLFKMLLKDAELEYGFKNEGPLLLPCDVDLFCSVLAEMDSGKEFDDSYACRFGYGSCSPFSPRLRLRKSPIVKGYGSYGRLTPPNLLKINHF